MAKVYTAAEMREGKHKSCECCDALKQIAAHVREAEFNGMEIFGGLKDMILNICREYIDKCDAAGREKKYEYACKWCDGNIKSVSEDFDLMKCLVDGYNSDEDMALLMRREVGEWREVCDGD